MVILYPIVATPKTTPKTLTEKIASYIRAYPEATRFDIAESLGISINTVKEYIRKLKEKKMLKRIGSSRSGYWEVTGGFDEKKK